MNLQDYFSKLRQKESEIEGRDIYLSSLETPDGGKAGIITQVPKRLGCQLIVEGKARLASEAEVEEHQRAEAERRAAMESAAYAQRIQVQVVADPRASGREPKAGRG